MLRFINIHTHHFSGEHTEPRAFGIHPWDAEKVDISTLDEYGPFTENEAIGEIGLDFACEVDREQQERLFCRQLEIAQRLGKPIILHCVKAFEPTLNLLSRYLLKAVIFHGFIGSKEQAETALKRGYYLSFGHRTRHSPKSIEALRIVPLNRIFVETDESDRTIEAMYEEIADLKGVTIEALLIATNENYRTIFEK